MAFASQQVSVSRQRSQPFSVVFIDLDGLKRINDHFGHDEGDVAIKEIGLVLTKTFRESDIVGRFGGDEFVVLTMGLDPEGADIIRARFAAELKAANQELRRPWELSASLGFFHSGNDCALSLEEMLKSADGALYAEKRRKKAASDKK
jgi:diguanylate cyclase (GGDEF)-like protein